jgi:hypothetical protein
VAAVSEHVTVKTEPPKSDLGLTTRFERSAIPGVERALQQHRRHRLRARRTRRRIDRRTLASAIS